MHIFWRPVHKHWHSHCPIFRSPARCAPAFCRRRSLGRGEEVGVGVTARPGPAWLGKLRHGAVEGMVGAAPTAQLCAHGVLPLLGSCVPLSAPDRFAGSPCPTPAPGRFARSPWVCPAQGRFVGSPFLPPSTREACRVPMCPPLQHQGGLWGPHVSPTQSTREVCRVPMSPYQQVCTLSLVSSFPRSPRAPAVRTQPRPAPRQPKPHLCHELPGLSSPHRPQLSPPHPAVAAPTQGWGALARVTNQPGAVSAPKTGKAFANSNKPPARLDPAPRAGHGAPRAGAPGTWRGQRGCCPQHHDVLGTWDLWPPALSRWVPPQPGLGDPGLAHVAMGAIPFCPCGRSR